jgi:hypothetical protein
VHPHPLAAEFAAAVARRDPRRLALMLNETVRLRALLPATVTVAHGRGDVAGSFAGWFADFDTLEVLESAAEPVADRLLIHYRLALSRAQTRWVCTQTAVCKILNGRLAVIDLFCSGFREVSHDDHTTAPSGSPSRARLVGVISIGTTPSRCSRRSARPHRCTRSRSPTATPPGWWWATTRPKPR